jgi:CRISPR-associated protein Csb2
VTDDGFVPVPPLTSFTIVGYRRANDALPRPFAAFALRLVDPDARTPWRPFHQERAVCVAAMLRHSACMAAKSDLDPNPNGWRTHEWFEQFIAGHGPRKPNGRYIDESWPRFSFLPLPSIGPAHADGMIRRVLMAEPHGGDGRSAAWAANRLTGSTLIEQTSLQPLALLASLRPGDSVLRQYVAQSNSAREWITVTPVILPGYDDARPSKRERLLRDCLLHAGYNAEAVESLEARPASWLAASSSIRALQRPAYLKQLPAIHVRMRFRTPVAGPIAIGAGRHCGLGVFAVNYNA